MAERSIFSKVLRPTTEEASKEIPQKDMPLIDRIQGMSPSEIAVLKQFGQRPVSDEIGISVHSGIPLEATKTSLTSLFERGIIEVSQTAIKDESYMLWRASADAYALLRKPQPRRK